MKSKEQISEKIHSDVTIADIKQCDGFESISDELAEKFVKTIKGYTEIIYNCFAEERFEEQKAKIVSLNFKERNNAA